MKRLLSAALLLLSAAVHAEPASDAQSETEIRATLARWVDANNRGDQAAANAIWAKGMVGWFPGGPEYSLAAAFALAGIPGRKDGTRSTYELKIEDVSVSGAMAAVHDIWTETLHFDGSTVTVKRVIRGSELWKRQPDGAWRIARWVSAPEAWERASP